MAPAVTEVQAEELLAAAAPFRDTYLGGALSRLNDAVGAAFPGGSRPLPTAADLQKCIGYDPQKDWSNTCQRRCWRQRQPPTAHRRGPAGEAHRI